MRESSALAFCPAEGCGGMGKGQAIAQGSEAKNGLCV